MDVQLTSCYNLGGAVIPLFTTLNTLLVNLVDTSTRTFGSGDVKENPNSGERVYELASSKYRYVTNDNILHSTTQPAVSTPRIDRWCINGETSRLDGPAVIHKDESGEILRKQYYIDDIEYSELQYWLEIERMKANGEVE